MLGNCWPSPVCIMAIVATARKDARRMIEYGQRDDAIERMAKALREIAEACDQEANMNDSL